MNPNILHSLIDIQSPSNFETDMRNHIKSIIPSHKHLSIISDRNTSLGYFLNKGKEKTILIDAHMDEISGQVVSILDNGFLSIQMTGPLIEYMHGRPLTILSSKLNKKVKGVIMIQHAHLKDIREDKEDYYNKENLYVDIGSSSKKETQSKIEIGDAVILDYTYAYLKKNIITSRGLDNKLGVFILIHLLQYFIKNINNLQYNVIFNFSGDEETGKSSVGHFNNINIDSVIVIDTDWSSDVPFIDQDVYGEINIGKGAVLTRSDEDDGLFKIFKHLSKKFNIPMQIVTPLSGGSMLNHYIKSYTVDTQFIGIPLRNIHSPVETSNLKDSTSVFNLIIKYLTQSIKMKTIKSSPNKRRSTKRSRFKRRYSKHSTSKNKSKTKRKKSKRKSKTKRQKKQT